MGHRKFWMARGLRGSRREAGLCDGARLWKRRRVVSESAAVILAFAAELPALLLGWILVRLLAPRAPLWVQIPLGAGIGVGIASCSYFCLQWAGLATRSSILGVEGIGVAVGAVLLFRQWRGARDVEVVKKPVFKWIWVPRLAAALALGIFISDFTESATANPNGEYDAVTIWNLRARYLAGGAETWRTAISPQMA